MISRLWAGRDSSRGSLSLGTRD